jgi:hypothetical protein
MHDIAEFLSKRDPFVALEPAELERLAERVEIEYFEPQTIGSLGALRSRIARWAPLRRALRRLRQG